jgi:hypothetical protein
MALSKLAAESSEPTSVFLRQPPRGRRSPSAALTELGGFTELLKLADSAVGIRYSGTFGVTDSVTVGIRHRGEGAPTGAFTEFSHRAITGMLSARGGFNVVA